MDVKNYDAVFQKYILEQVLNAPDIYVRCKNILRPEYFDTMFQSTVAFVSEYSDKYNILPTLDNIKVKTGCELQPTDVQLLHHEGVLQDVGEYCRHKAMEGAIVAGAKLLSEKRYGEVEALIKEAMLVSLQSDMGLDIYENPEEVISSLASMQGNFQSGWETLDFKLYGGFGKQELVIFAAESGGGKSVVLQNLAVNFSKMGKVGAYITLELAEELVSVRIYSMLTDRSPTSVKTNLDESAAEIAVQKHSNGTLRIKRLPESVTTVNDIEVYLRELQIKTGIKLDYICVDYLDLLTTDRVQNKSDTFTKDKFVSEELRALAFNLDLTVFTACQFNRSGISEDTKSTAQIAGGISKIYTADNVIFIITDRNNGIMWFDFQKTRNSSAVGSRLKMHYNIDTLKVSDHEETVADFQNRFKFKPSDKIITGSGNVVKTPQIQSQHASTLDKLKQNLSSSNEQTINTKKNELKSFLANRQ